MITSSVLKLDIAPWLSHGSVEVAQPLTGELISCSQAMSVAAFHEGVRREMSKMLPPSRVLCSIKLCCCLGETKHAEGEK